MDLRLYGEVGALSVDETVSARDGAGPAATEPAQTFEIVQSGRLEIAGPGGAAWQVTLSADTAPRIAPSGALERNASGEMTQSFTASDDYGVASARATIALDADAVDRRHGLAPDPDPRDPIAVELPLPITGERTEFTEALIEDFSKHPFAGLPVTVTFAARDAAGQVGRSDPLALEALPGRRFFDPLAKAIVEQRRDLLWARANGPRVARLLRAISDHPEGVFRVETDYLRPASSRGSWNARAQAGRATPRAPRSPRRCGRSPCGSRKGTCPTRWRACAGRVTGCRRRCARAPATPRSPS